MSLLQRLQVEGTADRGTVSQVVSRDSSLWELKFSLHQRVVEKLEQEISDINECSEEERERAAEQIREIMAEYLLENEKLFERVNEEEDIFLKISPFLLFTILIQQTEREMGKKSYMLEIVGHREQIPIFDAKDSVTLIQNKDMRNYLARMLASFTKVDSTTVVYRARGLTYQRHFSELDFDNVLELAGLVELPYRYDFYKRLADISLFITGIFPEYLQGSEEGNSPFPEKHMGHSERTLHDYEKEGRQYYDLASTYDEAREQGLDHVLSQLAENFTIIRKPLNYLAANLMSKQDKDWFISP